jgi:hypothetical protein
VGEGGHFVFALQGYMYVVSSYIATRAVRPSPPTSSSKPPPLYQFSGPLPLLTSRNVAWPPASSPQCRPPRRADAPCRRCRLPHAPLPARPAARLAHHPASISPRRSRTRISMHSATSHPIHSKTSRPLGLGLRSTPPSSPEGGSCVSFRPTRHPRLYLWMDNLTRLLGRALTECEGDFRYRVA